MSAEHDEDVRRAFERAIADMRNRISTSGGMKKPYVIRLIEEVGRENANLRRYLKDAEGGGVRASMSTTRYSTASGDDAAAALTPDQVRALRDLHAQGLT